MKTKSGTTKFYNFSQNNSGGNFIDDNTISVNVLIEALDYKDANDRAENKGIYFNGCEDDRDCPCCGDRWCPKSPYSEKINTYDTFASIEDAKKSLLDTTGMFMKWSDKAAIIYYIDGTKEILYYDADKSKKSKK